MYTACHPIDFEPMETKLPPLVFTGCAFKSQLRVIPGFGGARRVTLYGSNVDRSDTKESFFTPAPICLVIDVADDGILMDGRALAGTPYSDTRGTWSIAHTLVNQTEWWCSAMSRPVSPRDLSKEPLAVVEQMPLHEAETPIFIRVVYEVHDRTLHTACWSGKILTVALL